MSSFFQHTFDTKFRLSLPFLVNGKRKIRRMINAIPKWNLPATNFDDNSLETLTDRFEYNWYNLTGTLKVLFSPRSYFRHYFFLPIQALPAVKKKKKLMKLNFGWQVGPKLEPESPNSGAVGYLEIVLESWSMFCRIAPYECLGDEFWPSFPGLLRTLCNGPWMKWYPPILLLSTLNLKMA